MELGYVYWKQCMKNIWICLGDCPSHLMYSKVQRVKKRNIIVMFKHNSGEWLTEPSQSATNVKDHIQRIQQSKPPDNLSQETDMVLRELDFTPMSSEAQNLLAQPFSEDEIKKAMFSIDGSKYFGSDGFSYEFFEKH